MCSISQFTDLTYMGDTGPCGPMTIIFGTVIQSQYTSLNIKFGVNRTFHVLNIPVYRFDLYGRYRTLFTDDDNFLQCYLELIYKPKCPIWCESDFPCSRSRYTGLVYMGGTRSCRPIQPIFNTNQRIGNRSLCANVQLFVFGRNRVYHRRTDGQTDIKRLRILR